MEGIFVSPVLVIDWVAAPSVLSKEVIAGATAKNKENNLANGFDILLRIVVINCESPSGCKYGKALLSTDSLSSSVAASSARLFSFNSGGIPTLSKIASMPFGDLSGFWGLIPVSTTGGLKDSLSIDYLKREINLCKKLI
ncbi:MAG: hypothetical protein ACD_72C00085G0001 [uncultured bacterium]|nr:MAG: hypothetical protein ACD_72C00085G0001 [uncultured bacterium]